MNSSYLNMAAGSFLGTVFVVMSVSLVSEALFHTDAPEQEGFAIEVAEAETGGDGGAEAAGTPISVLMANADPAAGEAAFRRCASCHTIDEGGANRTGPNLWDIVGMAIAEDSSYNYSGAMVEFSEGGAQTWDYEHLNGFLAAPRSYISGTSMSFAGVSNEEDRADLIAYLREQSSDPVPLPEPEEVAAEEEGDAEAPADGAEAPADEAAPAEGEDAAAEGEAAPAEEGEAAPAEEEAAPADGEAAPADDAAPAENGEEAAPVEEEAAPADEDAAAPAEEEAAPAEEEAAPADEEAAAPAADDAAAADEDAAAPADASGPAVALLGEADAANGENLFRRCAACHSVDEGGQNRVGPNLFGIVNRPVASAEGFNYSAAMTEYAQGGEVVWDYGHLDAFLAAPRDEVSGTSMAFPGVSDDGDRADVIAYLRSLAAEPAPLP
jgi:cytochrome c2